jgi:hypothetical protein
LPQDGDFVGGEDVGLVDEVGELAFEVEGFGGLGAGRFDGADVFVAEAFECGDGEGIFLAADARYLPQPASQGSSIL